MIGIRLLTIWAVILALNSAPLEANDAMRLRYTRTDCGDGKTITGHGSCFAISEHDILTAAHNVLPEYDKNGQPCGEPFATLQVEVGGKWVAAKFVRSCNRIDIAWLHCDEKLEWIEIAKQDAPVGTLGIVHGRQRDGPLSMYYAKVTSRFFEGWTRDVAAVPFDHALSGACFMKDKLCLGMMVAGVPKSGDIDNTRGLFLPASMLRWFIDGGE
ncbi:MAG: hypothetical protein WC100_03435 [Sterolibacterium sp.]